MSLSPFFHSLRASYQSEIDDLTSDSEGRDVLRQRLAAKRREIGFLVQMMEISPEMVAVAFHQGFRITQPQVMEHLVTLDPDDFPPWDSLDGSFEWQPWARDLAAVVLQEPGGEAFLTLTLALEYLHGRPGGAPAASRNEEDDETEIEDGGKGDAGRREGPSSNFDEDDADNQRLRDEAGADWMAEQGFDRKD